MVRTNDLVECFLERASIYLYSIWLIAHKMLFLVYLKISFIK